MANTQRMCARIVDALKGFKECVKAGKVDLVQFCAAILLFTLTPVFLIGSLIADAIGYDMFL